MSGYALHPEAFDDIDGIREHIAEDSADAADRVVAEIFDGIHGLVAFPNQGYRRPSLTSRPLRFKLVREYVMRTRRRRNQCGLWPYSTDAAALA